MEEYAIPVVFAVVRRGQVTAGPVTFRDGTFSVEPAEDTMHMSQLRGGKARGKALVIDAESLSGGVFNPHMVAHAKLSGTDLWLAETVADLSDLTDAFLGNMQKIVFPVHTLASDAMMEAIQAASDSCIPMVVCRRGKGMGIADITEAAARAKDCGYSNMIVLDADGTSDPEVLRSAERILPGIGVISPSGVSPYGGMRFRHCFGYSFLR